MKRALALIMSICMAVVILSPDVVQGETTSNNPEGVFVRNESTDAFRSHFRNPPGSTRPRTRWWVPGSHMTKQEIENEILSMVEAGFGGAEVVPVSTSGEGGSDIDWGTPEWIDMSKHMLEVAGWYDFTIDFTMTPAWPLALPSIVDLDDPSQGAQMELDGQGVDGITALNPYNGAVPVPPANRLGAGTPVLLAVTAAKYADKATKTLDYDSVRSIDQGQITRGGANPTDYTVSFTPDDDGEYVLFGWWQHPSGKTKYDNYQVDHFGMAGARAIVDYWETELIPEYGDAFDNVTALFIDSLEFETHLDWTYGVLDEFYNRKGYDLTPYLPGLYQQSATGNYGGNPNPDYQFNVNQQALRNDFFDVMTGLYIDNHIKPLSAFCRNHGVSLRYQTSYGKNLELAQTAMYVDIPETETLYGADIIDFYRLQSGAVHLTDKSIYSIEASPEQNLDLGFFQLKRGNGEDGAANYQQTWGAQLWHLQRAFAGGVNQAVFHGHSYGGQYEGEGNDNGYLAGVSWPGFEGFGKSSWANSWGERIPSWTHARTYTDFIARNQYILQQGTAKVDLAVFAHRYWEVIDYSGPSKVYQDGGLLEQLGYSYDFVSPSGFLLPEAVAENGVLAPQGPGYKAVLIDNETAIPYETAERLLAYARAGLPIVIIGNVPSEDSYNSGKDMSGLIAQLLEQDSVVTLPDTSQVADALVSVGVTPDAAYSARQPVVSLHRSLQDVDLYYLYHYGDANNYPSAKTLEEVSLTVTLKGEGRPYLLDAWTGEITPIAKFIKGNGDITLTLAIGGNDSVLVAVGPENWVGDYSTTPRYVTSAGLDVEYDPDGRLLAKTENAAKTPVWLDDGEILIASFSLDVPEPIELTGWTLAVESWTPGDTPTDTHTEDIAVGGLTSLVAWKEMPGLESVSGIGTYSTEFTLGYGWEDGMGAVLELGDIKDTYRITINDTTLISNQLNRTVDIGRYLNAENNILEIEVASTLLNAVLAVNPSDRRTTDAYGILNPVVLRPYVWSYIEDADDDTGPSVSQDSLEVGLGETSKELLVSLGIGEQAAALATIEVTAGNDKVAVTPTGPIDSDTTLEVTGLDLGNAYLEVTWYANTQSAAAVEIHRADIQSNDEIGGVTDELMNHDASPLTDDEEPEREPKPDGETAMADDAESALYAGTTNVESGEDDEDVVEAHAAVGSAGDQTTSVAALPDGAIMRATIKIEVVGEYSVTFISEGLTYASSTAEVGKAVKQWPQDPSRTGYTFLGWYSGPNGTGDRYSSDSTIHGGITLYAHWYSNTSARSGGSGRGGGNGGSSGGPNTNTVPSWVTGSVSAAIANITEATALAAVDRALNSGSTGIRFQNPGTISLGTMNAMVASAGDRTLTIYADSVSGNAVDVRLYVKPAQAVTDLILTASIRSTRATAVKELFAKWFSNNVMVVSLEHEGNFGQEVEVAVKLSEALVDKEFVLYTYNSTSNLYNRHSNQTYRIDANGYIHFFVTTGGNYVISDGVLHTKRVA